MDLEDIAHGILNGTCVSIDTTIPLHPDCSPSWWLEAFYNAANATFASVDDRLSRTMHPPMTCTKWSGKEKQLRNTLEDVSLLISVFLFY
jgi:hypothetical protein